MERKSKWLCLDCSVDLSLPGGDYYGLKDYLLRVDEITPADQFLIDQVSSEAKEIRTVALAAFEDGSGSLPQVSDLFYIERLEFLVDIGKVKIVQDAPEFMDIRVVHVEAK